MHDMGNDSSIPRKLIMALIYCAAVVLSVVALFIPVMNLEGLGSLNMLDVYGFGSTLATLGSETDLDGGIAILRFMSIYFIWLPLIMLVISAVLIFFKRKTELGFGIGIAVIPSVLFLNIGNILAIDILSGLYQEESLWDDGEYFSYMPFVLNIIAALAIFAVIVIMFIQEKDGKMYHAPKPEPAYGLVRITNGTLAGSSVTSPTSAKLMDMTPLKIGRGPGVDITIVNAAKSVSKQHCVIMYDSNECKYYVTDISSYGTSLGNGTKLVKNMKTPVAKGTVVTLAGKEQLSLE